MMIRGPYRLALFALDDLDRLELDALDWRILSGAGCTDLPTLKRAMAQLEGEALTIWRDAVPQAVIGGFAGPDGTQLAALIAPAFRARPMALARIGLAVIEGMEAAGHRPVLARIHDDLAPGRRWMAFLGFQPTGRRFGQHEEFVRCQDWDLLAV